MIVRSDGSSSILTRILRITIMLPAALLKTIKTTAAATDHSPYQPPPDNSNPVPRRTILGRLYGWPPPKSQRETAWLDGLRGIAAFLVMSLHLNTIFLGFDSEAPFGAKLKSQGNATTYALWRLPLLRIFTGSGHAMVSVFFVLSGFVLSWSSFGVLHGKDVDALQQQQQQGKLLGGLSSAAFRRWMRLYVPCFVVGLLPFLELRLGIQGIQGVSYSSNIFLQFWDYVWACERFSRPWLRERRFPNWIHKYNWVMWTIPLEFEGSLLVFFMVLVLARVKDYMRRTVILSALIIYSAATGYWVYWLFMSGMLTADYVKQSGGFDQIIERTTTRSRISWWLVFFLGLWLAAVPAPVPAFDRPGYTFLDNLAPSAYKDAEGGTRFWWAIAGILILVSSCHLQAPQRLCGSALLRYMGRISFMLYLTHQSISPHIVSLYRTWFSGLWGEKYFDDYSSRDMYKFNFLAGAILFLTSWIVVLIPAVFVAHWCEVLVDAPSLKFARWVECQFVEPEKSMGHARTVSQTGVSRAAAHANTELLPLYVVPHSD